MRKMAMVLGAAVGFVAAICFADDAPPPAPVLPKTAEKNFSISDNGAVSDATTLNTAAIQKALDACTKAGGGTVTIPAGTFVTGCLRMGNGVALHLEKGAVLEFAPNRSDITLRGKAYLAMITAQGAHDVSITGEGTIDGNGAPWWKDYARAVKGTATSKPAAALPTRPVLVQFTNCTHLLVKDVTLSNSPSSAIKFSGSNFTVDHVHFSVSDFDSANTDGIDITGHSILVSGSTLDVGEDNIAIRPTGDAAAGAANCQDITIADCSFLHGKGLSVGTTTLGGLKNLLVKNCTFEGTQNGLRMRASRTGGGTVDGVTLDHVTMKDVKTPIIIASYSPTIPADAATDAAQSVTNATPVWKNIRFSDVTADGAMAAGHIVGLAEQPATDITFSNVHITADKGLEIFHAKNVKMDGSSVSAAKGPAVIATDAEVSGIDANKANPADNLP